jgi:hypothetical protein
LLLLPGRPHNLKALLLQQLLLLLVRRPEPLLQLPGQA